MGLKLGLDCKLYRLENGAWVELTNAKDVTLGLDKDTADVTTRGGDGWKQTVGTLKDASIDFEMVWDTSDTHFAAVFASFLNNTAIKIAVMDGDISAAAGASQGLVAYMSVVKCGRNEKLTEAVIASVSLKPTYGATAPTWVSSPVAAA